MTGSDPYSTLLDALIRHLEQEKRRGTRFVHLDPALLTPRPPARTAAPAPAPAPAAAAPAARPSGSGVATPAAPANPPARGSALPSLPTVAPVPQPTPTEPMPPRTRPSTAPLNRQKKEEAMAELRARVLACQKCPNLASSRNTVVFGVGDIHSPLMFVGEAPGADEDQQGEPFVGKAGQLLTKIIQTMAFDRDSVFIANILKCRPDTPGQTAGNRKPTSDEMATCSPYLIEQIGLIRPQVIVALGATAVEGLLGKTLGITRLRGQWQEFQGVPLMPTYHPAYLLRNQLLSEKRKVWEDMLQVLERLGRPISEKQRGYFL